MAVISMYKSLSWFVVSYVVIGVPTVLLTDELWHALVATLAACALKTPVYYLHERLWHKPVARARDHQRTFSDGEGV